MTSHFFSLSLLLCTLFVASTFANPFPATSFALTSTFNFPQSGHAIVGVDDIYGRPEWSFFAVVDPSTGKQVARYDFEEKTYFRFNRILFSPKQNGTVFFTSQYQGIYSLKDGDTAIRLFAPTPEQCLHNSALGDVSIVGELIYSICGSLKNQIHFHRWELNTGRYLGMAVTDTQFGGASTFFQDTLFASYMLGQRPPITYGTSVYHIESSENLKYEQSFFHASGPTSLVVHEDSLYIAYGSRHHNIEIFNAHNVTENVRVVETHNEPSDMTFFTESGRQKMISYGYSCGKDCFEVTDLATGKYERAFGIGVKDLEGKQAHVGIVP